MAVIEQDEKILIERIETAPFGTNANPVLRGRDTDDRRRSADRDRAPRAERGHPLWVRRAPETERSGRPADRAPR